MLSQRLLCVHPVRQNTQLRKADKLHLEYQRLVRWDAGATERRARKTTIVSHAVTVHSAAQRTLVDSRVHRRQNRE